MMHALEDSFSMVMYRGTHDINMYNDCVLRNYTVRLILKKGQGDMWHEALCHSGEK